MIRSTEVDPTSEEREAILNALPPAILSYRGGVASLILEREGRVLDAAVRLDEGAVSRVWLRPLPTHDPSGLESWITLLERRHGQLAHELSGPATGVLAALETVIEYEPIPESSRQLLEDARAGMMRLTRLLEHPSRTSSGRPNLIDGPLEQLVWQWVSSVRQKLDPTGERLALEVRAEPENVRCDAALAREAVEVLVGNAWKFRRGQQVHVTLVADRADGGLRLSASDDGRGIARDTLERAGELGFSSRPSGVGLGLFLLRWAARRCGGVSLVQATESGARVSVFIPSNTSTHGRPKTL